MVVFLGIQAGARSKQDPRVAGVEREENFNNFIELRKEISKKKRMFY